MKRITLVASIIPLIFVSTNTWSETRYVTDEFKVTLRTGGSTSNNILSMLKSGQAVQLIEQDNETKYSLIETKNGKKGYVLSRFLDNQPSGRELYKKLKITSKQQKETIKSLKNDLNQVKQTNLDLRNQANTLSLQLSTTSDELKQLKISTKDTIKIIAQNNDQQTLIQTLEEEKATLLAENNEFKDSTAMDWFIRGSGVSLLAFLIGIIVTRIKWQKRDSWNNF